MRKKLSFWQHMRNSIIDTAPKISIDLQTTAWFCVVFIIPLLSLLIPVCLVLYYENLWFLVGCFSIIPTYLLSEYINYRDNPDYEEEEKKKVGENI